MAEGGKWDEAKKRAIEGRNNGGTGGKWGAPTGKPRSATPESKRAHETFKPVFGGEKIRWGGRGKWEEH